MIVHDNHPIPRCCKQNVCWTQAVFSAQCHVSFSQVHLNQFLQVIEKECCLARGNISPEKIFRPALHCKPVTSGCWKSIPAKEKAAALCKVIEILQWAGPSTACVRLTKFCKGKTLSSPHSPSFGEVYSVHVSLKFWTIDRNSTSSKARFQVLIIYLIRWTAAIPPYHFAPTFWSRWNHQPRMYVADCLITFESSIRVSLLNWLVRMWSAPLARYLQCGSYSTSPHYVTKTSELHWTWLEQGEAACICSAVRSNLRLQIGELRLCSYAPFSLQQAIGVQLNFEDISSQCVENPGTMHKCKTSGFENRQDATRNWTMTFVSDSR